MGSMNPTLPFAIFIILNVAILKGQPLPTAIPKGSRFANFRCSNQPMSLRRKTAAWSFAETPQRDFLRRSHTRERRFSYSHHESTLPESKLVPDQNQPATIQ